MDNSHLRGIKNDIIRTIIFDLEGLHAGAPASYAATLLKQKNPGNDYTVEAVKGHGQFTAITTWHDGKKYAVKLPLVTYMATSLLTEAKRALYSSRVDRYLFPMAD